MKMTITQTQFRDAFRAEGAGRDEFSDNGLDELFTWLVDTEADTGEELELDVIALCLQFAEYENGEQLFDDCDGEITVIYCGDDSFIIQKYINTTI